MPIALTSAPATGCPSDVLLPARNTSHDYLMAKMACPAWIPYSRDWVMMKLPLRVTYDTDVERVRKLIK